MGHVAARHYVICGARDPADKWLLALGEQTSGAPQRTSDLGKCTSRSLLRGGHRNGALGTSPVPPHSCRSCCAAKISRLVPTPDDAAQRSPLDLPGYNCTGPLRSSALCPRTGVGGQQEYCPRSSLRAASSSICLRWSEGLAPAVEPLDGRSGLIFFVLKSPSLPCG